MKKKSYKKEYELVVIGGGPAGLGAAIEAAKVGTDVLMIDENDRPGGQLFKQIHKFFGSNDHRAGQRGFQIGLDLLQEAQDAGIDTALDTSVYGLFEDHIIGTVSSDGCQQIKARAIVLATGASEKSLVFPGWTLPGVMGAGAIQTQINVWRVLPGQKYLIVGSGNVGLIVAYQLTQAGGEVVAVIEATPEIGGYGVHAAKISRAGVPIMTGETILRADGRGKVEEAVIASVGSDGSTVPGSEKNIAVDTIGIAVGLTPLAELAWLRECRRAFIPELGGLVPLHNKEMHSSVEGVFLAGDIAGVEEASTALDEGRLAGVAAACYLEKLKTTEAEDKKTALYERLADLRSGPFGNIRQQAKERLVSMW